MPYAGRRANARVLRGLLLPASRPGLTPVALLIEPRNVHFYRSFYRAVTVTARKGGLR